MQITPTATSSVRPPAAHLPAINGYSPLGGEYGDARILCGPSPRNGTFPTVDAAIEAARKVSSDFDTAAGVFQVGAGAFQVGSALVADSGDDRGPSELTLSSRLASMVVFDDPALRALVDRSVVARR